MMVAVVIINFLAKLYISNVFVKHIGYKKKRPFQDAFKCFFSTFY